MTRKCRDCYFYDECETKRVCDYFSPLDELEYEFSRADANIELERQVFRKRFFDSMKEEDRWQEYFG